MRMPKLQYYSEDLARLLSIGKITDMFVVVEEGKQILRVECTASPGNEYKTVTTKSAKKPTTTHKNTSRQNQTETKPKSPAGIGDRIMDGVGNFMSKKTKPPWME